MSESPFCACGKLRHSNQRVCKDCHSAYMRAWRKTHPLSPEQRKKMNSRCYANVYQRRGKLVQEPCKKCGSPNSQKHHPDYDKPLQVVWLCRSCHLELHGIGA